jgi:hypothetical protein
VEKLNLIGYNRLKLNGLCILGMVKNTLIFLERIK